MVTMRSVSGMKLERMLSRVVLPEPVPPVTTMLRRSRTATIRNSSIGWLSEPKVSRSFPSSLRLANFRMLMLGRAPRRNDGVDAGAILQSRVDHRRAFVDAATEGVTMRSMADSTARSLVKTMGTVRSGPHVQ